MWHIAHDLVLASLKMLGLWFYSLKVSGKYCFMLRVWNELTLQKELQNCMTKTVF